MNETIASDEPAPTRLVAGALAHLARHMTTGCPRAAELAALLLARIAEDPDADPHLRAHARELVDIMERDQSADGRRLTATAGNLAGRMPH
ncbi:MAG: hypothetical protein IPG33_03230 [Betaproteobacteria bacterium]|jgi:hypothetical protein|nr:hypothetical protein [Betaproteobacteria bacterium]